MGAVGEGISITPIQGIEDLPAAIWADGRVRQSLDGGLPGQAAGVDVKTFFRAKGKLLGLNGRHTGEGRAFSRPSLEETP
jgi:hypothetical protein